MSEQKTHAEIIAEMRKYRDLVINGQKYPDRLEAAHKREIDALTEELDTAKHCWKVWSDRADELLSKCNEQSAKLKTLGNAAKLREVVGDLLYMAERYAGRTPATETVIFDPETKKEIRTINYYAVIEKAQSILSGDDEEPKSKKE